jgi:SAM-dependent methyltransferase
VGTSPYSGISIEGAHCPFCWHEGRARVLYEVTSDQAATHFVSPRISSGQNARLASVIRRLWNRLTCQLVRCGYCDGVFAFPFVAGDSEFYEVACEGQNAGFYPSNRWEYGESLRFCQQSTVSLETSSCLEIGAGDGAFLKCLIGAGVPQRDVTALEYSQYGQSAIRCRYPDVDVRHGDDLTNLRDGAFSHIFLFQVMEHLGSLDSFVAQLRRLLKEGGWAFISVPNPLKTEFNELNGLLLDMPPNHVSRFTDGAVKSLFTRNGLSVEKLADEDFSWREAVPEYVHYRYLRLGQTPGTIPARIDAALSGSLRKLVAGLFMVALLPEALLKLSASRKVGGSRLLVVQKRAV